MSAMVYGGMSGEDPITLVERDMRATVGAAWWPSAPPNQRMEAMASRMLALADGSWWVFGAGARWYRRHPSDGLWYLSPPPYAALTRSAAQSPRPGLVPPPIPPQLVPAGPDFAFELPMPTGVIGAPMASSLTVQMGQIVGEAAAAPPGDYPLVWDMFARGTPSTVGAIWGAMLWCASVPAFDPDLDPGLLDLWKPYLVNVLVPVDRLRWIMPPPLDAIADLYGERLGVGRADCAGQIIRFMVMTAQALKDDQRFQPRADVLLAVLEPLTRNPSLDYGALRGGGAGVEAAWLGRCPPHLAPAVYGDAAPGERLRHAWYDLSRAVAPLCGDPTSPAFVEPRYAATSLFAADMAGYRPDLAEAAGPWLGPEARGLLYAILGQRDHGLRRLWPVGERLTDAMRSGLTSEIAMRVLGAAAALDVAWCRIAGGIPAPADGFDVPEAFARELSS